MAKHTLRSALLLVLDQVDYLAAACSPTEMVGAVLPTEVIRIARQALAEDAGDPPEQESFQDAVRADPDMTPEQKAKWLKAS